MALVFEIGLTSVTVWAKKSNFFLFDICTLPTVRNVGLSAEFTLLTLYLIY